MRTEQEIRDTKKRYERDIKKFQRQSEAFQYYRQILELLDWILEETE